MHFHASLAPEPETASSVLVLLSPEHLHFVDFKDRAASKGELQRFVQKFGLTPLIDKSSRRYQDLGLGASRLSDDRWLKLLTEEPHLLMQPLTRFGGKLTLGVAESEWTGWIDAERAK